MNQRPIARIRLTLLANRAAPSPVLGQALGQYGINMMDFCKKFNNQTKNIKETVYIPTSITVYSSNHFEIVIKTPTTSYLFKQIAEASEKPPTSEASASGRDPLGKNPDVPIWKDAHILLKEIYHIAILKKCDRLMNHLSIKSICKTLISTAQSMGLPVLGRFGAP